VAHGNQHSGEQQFPEQFSKFLLDPGFTRMITITVQAADPTQAGIGTYVVRVKREGCPPGRPFFDPVKRLCVQNCNEGTYPDKDRHRCARCNDNCHVCSDFSDCRMCLPDSADYTYTLRTDGSCRAEANHLFLQYRWWFFAVGASLLLLLCVGCMGLCTLVQTQIKGLHADSESEDDEVHLPSPPRPEAREMRRPSGPRPGGPASSGSYGSGGHRYEPSYSPAASGMGGQR